ncbi:MAG: NusG domain II-containing protein [Clostridia bacterium]|nr:NusG domain II-containing protein [Clostridia bacterium]
MKKADVKLIICLVAVGIIALMAVLLCSKNGKTVVITQNNKQLYSLSLSEDKIIDLGTNIIEIKNGKVEVISANCKNQICVKHKKISKKSEQIVCIPNKVIITVE